MWGNMTIKVIEFYAPPSSGKSTLAAACYVEMGYRGRTVQLIDEYVKNLADRKEYIPTRFDQPTIMGNQGQLVYNAIRAGYEAIFCQSSPRLCAWFSEWYHPGKYPSFQGFVTEWERDIEAQFGVEFIRIFIELPEQVYRERYKAEGRFEDLETCLAMQSHMKKWLSENVKNLIVVHETNATGIITQLGL